MQCDLLFPTTIYLDFYDDIDNDQIIDFFKKNNNGVNKTNIGGYQSQDNLFSYSICNYLKKRIEKSLFIIKDSLKITNELFVDNAWININKKGNYNARHTHPRSFLSGVYYLKAESVDNGCIIFHNPVQSKIMLEPDYETLNNLTTNVIKYEPVVGRVILFPSWIEHSVEANKLDSERISVSFNIFYRSSDERSE